MDLWITKILRKGACTLRYFRSIFTDVNRLPAKARLADHLIDGGLEPLIRAERAKTPPTSFENIAKAIEEATGRQVEVTGVSVMAWSRRLGIATARGTAADATDAA